MRVSCYCRNIKNLGLSLEKQKNNTKKWCYLCRALALVEDRLSPVKFASFLLSGCVCLHMVCVRVIRVCVSLCVYHAQVEPTRCERIVICRNIKKPWLEP